MSIYIAFVSRWELGYLLFELISDSGFLDEASFSVPHIELLKDLLRRNLANVRQCFCQLESCILQIVVVVEAADVLLVRAQSLRCDHELLLFLHDLSGQFFTAALRGCAVGFFLFFTDV